MAIEKVLIADDEELMRRFLKETLERKQLEVTVAENGKAALLELKNKHFDLVITDMKLGDITGLEVLKKTKEVSPETIIIVITAFGTIENAVEAMKLGAFTYLIKPFCKDTIEAAVEKAREHLTLISENQFLREQISKGGKESKSRFVFESPAMKAIFAQITQVAKSNASVFISGESGTGKEVVAQAIHDQSLRHNNPYIKVNCAAIPETLMESEFFGHEKGAFTGASAKRLGRFELGNSGTLFLDEVTEIPISLQAKLLRAIQEKEFERVGGTKPVKVDVRLISTTNRNIQEAIKNKVIREDLYYRLNVVPIHIPPLKERKEDILTLANYFLERTSLENKFPKKTLSKDAEKKLLGYSFPGNVRELGNIIERAAVMNSAQEISAENLYLN
ncbi:MAG TPA: sigma-54 dependent transcriptional regulator [Parachlamydiaceae bacterium]|nr:sigma-54 dependent transcriptional regulator [Parachlamydiaceae bacterium]